MPCRNRFGNDTSKGYHWRPAERCELPAARYEFDARQRPSIGSRGTYVSDIERDARNPTISIVEELAKLLKITACPLLD